MSRPLGELEIMGPVGADWEGGMSAATALTKIKAMGDVRRIKVTINSPGGSAFDGVAIYNALKDTGRPVDVAVLGLAASAASIVAMAGDTITMHEGAMMMIHRAWALAIGNAETMGETAAMLEKLDGQMAGIYAGRAEGNKKEILALMSAETWMTGQEAIDAGLATERKGRRDEQALSRVAAMLADPQFKYQKTPDSLRVLMPAALAEKKPEKVEDKPMPEELKKPDPTPPPTPDPPKPEALDAKAITAEAIKVERERAAAISATAKEYGFEADAAELIKAGVSANDAKLALMDKKIKALAAASPNIQDAAPAETKGAVDGFEAAVQAHIKAGKSAKDAIRAAVIEDPARHEAYLKAKNTQARKAA